MVSAGIKVSGRMRNLLSRLSTNGFLLVAEGDNKNTDLFGESGAFSCESVMSWGREEKRV